MDDERLLDLATSISDGEVVDWEKMEQEAEGDEQRKVVHALKELSSIAKAHQSWHESLVSQDFEEREVDPPLPVRWGNLEILEKVGEGSFGEVFRARDPQLDREVALKLLRRHRGPDSEKDMAVLEEGRLLARVRHPNVATVYGADQRDGRVGLWMEYLHGRTLSELVQEQGPFGAREAALIGLDLCRALAAVHAQGILHRDIKAQNVMRETGGRIVLMDFGVGRDLRRESLPDHSLSGTPLYLAPEVLAGGEASTCSDLYSLGVLLFHLVTGTFPARGRSLEELGRIHEQDGIQLLRDARPDLPDSFVWVVDKTLARDPAHRYPSAGTLEQALQKVLRLEEDSALKRRKKSTPWLRYRWSFLVLALALVLLTGLALWRQKQASPSSSGPPRSVLVGDFENRTGVALFDPTIRHLVILALSQSPSIKIMPHDRVVEALQRMGKPPTTPLVPGTARELCLREGIPTWITGGIAKSKIGFTITISAVNAQSGEVQALEIVSLRSPKDLIPEMGDVTVALRHRLGEPESLIEQNRLPLEQVTTPSLEALYRFSQALELHAEGKIDLAIEALEAAVRLDPQFASAHNRLAIYAGGTGDYERAFRAAGRAYELRDRVSERERYQISATYHLDCMQYEKALKDFQQAIILDPTDSSSYRQIALLHANLGEPHAGIEPARKARDLPPPSVINEGVLILLLAGAGRPDDALKEVNAARGQFGRETYLYWVEGIAWQVKGDPKRAQRAFQALTEGGTTYMSHGRLLLAQSLMMEGRLQEAAALLESGFGLDKRQNYERNGAIGTYLLAKTYTLLGHTELAERLLPKIEKLPDLPIHLKMLRATAVLCVEIGDLDRARRLLLRIEKLRDRYPSALSRGAAAQVRGEIEAAQGHFDTARSSFDEARLYWEDMSTLRSFAHFWRNQGKCDAASPIIAKIKSERARIYGDFFSSWSDYSDVQLDSRACES
jgi:serine/threonine protein kinase/tetratricopeptide (TPR) repeat protein